MAKIPRRVPTIPPANNPPSTMEGGMRGRNMPTSALVGVAPSDKFSPFKELGTSGFAVFGGRVMSHEKNVKATGPQKWITYSELLANTSIVAAAVRYFLNIVAHAKWTITPVDDSPEAETVAQFIDEVLNSMETPWRRIARRAAMYRFHGFGIQEWTAKRRDDGKIGLDDIEVRPSHTIDRWQVDEKGTVLGVWQLSPQLGTYIYLPRPKIIYIVEDTITDSPEGLGLFRHLLDPYLRLQKFLTLEGQGYERDLRGIPIGRVPYRAIAQWVDKGEITAEEGRRMVDGIENFVKIQCKSEDTSIVLDSVTYIAETDSGKQITGIPQFGLELLQGQSSDFAALAAAIQRLNQEMARVIGAEHLMLGGEGAANRALSEDKSRNFYLTVNGTLDDIVDAVNKDVIRVICDLNGVAEDLRPTAAHSDVSFRSVMEITSSLAQMASAGAVLTPDDPAIEDVRDLLGISKPPEPSPERLGMLGFEDPAKKEQDKQQSKELQMEHLAALREQQAQDGGEEDDEEARLNGRKPPRPRRGGDTGRSGVP